MLTLNVKLCFNACYELIQSLARLGWTTSRGHCHPQPFCSQSVESEQKCLWTTETAPLPSHC